MNKLIFLVALTIAVNTQAEVNKLTLKNDKLEVQLTNDIGGRLLSIAQKGQPNFLRISDLVETNPNPVVTPESENVGYLGHEIWVGPQSQWWLQQSVNEKRAETKATWPPDPYLILAKNTLLEASAKRVVMKSPASPVSGLEVVKSYELLGEKPELKMTVSHKNIRSEPVAWDIWFNTRVHAATQVYIPVAQASDVRVVHMADENTAPLDANLQDGLFTLEMTDPSPKRSRKGKVFIHPSQGWMAGFYKEQLFIIRFDLQKKSSIHNEQGQIELYNDFIPTMPKVGLLEMELHAPYKTLAPGEVAMAHEVWTLLTYKGLNSRSEQIKFLKEQLPLLGIDIRQTIQGK